MFTDPGIMPFSTEDDSNLMISQKDKKRFRAIGHHLKPVVTVAGNGLSESVLGELSRALHDHELIKVKILAGDKDEREALIATLVKTQHVTVVQKIGHIVLIYKAVAKPNPALSNILRATVS